MALKGIEKERAEEEAGIITSAVKAIRLVAKKATPTERRDGTLALKVDGVLELTRMAYGEKAYDENGVEHAVLSLAAVAA